jgi:cysteinyl-tRNA synthetase
MSMKYLGETFDLHAGGIDLIFPHHENEIAQSSCGTGQPFARHWFHCHHLLVENETMSKSKGNTFSVPEVVARGGRPDALRYLLGAAHYRSTMNFSWEGLQQAAATLDRIHGFVKRLSEVSRDGPVADEVERVVAGSLRSFETALSDDLNTPEALAAVHGLVGEGNALLARGLVTREGAARLRAGLQAMDGVFAVLMPPDEERLAPEEQALLDERQQARKAREYGRADELREELERKGVLLEDTPVGTRWRRKR